MKKIAAAVLLCALLALGAPLALSGCALLSPHDTTVVLPTLEPQQAFREEEGTPFSVQRINQYAFSTSCISLRNNLPVVGWSSGYLYTVDGAPGERVTVRRVDPRYGFYEDCADLGVLNYNNLSLSSDGRYVAYDVTTQEGRLELHCYTVASKEDRVVAEYLSPSPWLMMNYAWTQDGESFYYWFELNSNGRAWETEWNRYEGALPDQMEQFDLLNAEGFPFNQVLRVDARTGSRSTALVIEEMLCTREYIEPVGGMETAYGKNVWISPDGALILVNYWLEGTQMRWLLAKDGQEQAAQSRYIEELLIWGGGSMQLTEHYLLGETMQQSQDKEWVNVPFLCRDGSSTANLWELSGSTAYLLQLSPDEEHLLAVLSGDGGETALWVYELDETGQPRMDTGRLLYQSVQEIASVWVSPDQTRAVILSRSNYYPMAEEYAGGDALSAPRYAYTITVLEM